MRSKGEAYYPATYFAEITRRELNPYTGRAEYIAPQTISKAELECNEYYVSFGVSDYRVKFKGEVIEKFDNRADAERLVTAFNNLRRAV